MSEQEEKELIKDSLQVNMYNVVTNKDAIKLELKKAYAQDEQCREKLIAKLNECDEKFAKLYTLYEKYVGINSKWKELMNE